MAPAIHFRSAVVVLGRFPALAGVDLVVEAGEGVLLQGPNGAGKTTLLRACAGLVPVVGGEAEVLGHDLRRQPRAVRRRVGLLGHTGFLYDDLTVEESVVFGARAAGTRAAAALSALTRLGLDGRLRRTTVARLSAGQRRRVSLAVLVARWPELWLLDEPFAGLDTTGRAVMHDVIAEARTGGATVVIASHEVDPARLLVPRTVTVAGGQVSEGARVA